MSASDGRVVSGQRACARPEGCCASGPPARWCAALRASLAGALDGVPALVDSLPRLHAPVQTEHGPGRVVRIHVARQLATVEIAATGALMETPLSALRPSPDDPA